jgi:hypothetical protein
MECALGAQRENRPFYHGLDYASRLSSHTSDDAQVYPLDELNLPITFAKFHLEGSELDALAGGLTTLCSHRPLLAVTLYHNRDGLWRIPSMLMNALSEYDFLLRLHAWCGTGCVLYGIPQERKVSRDS